MKNHKLNNFLKLLDILKIYYSSKYAAVEEISNRNPFKVLISTILSARTKDEITLEVSKKLFSKIKSFEDLQKVSIEELEKIIYPVGFYKNKARYLKQLAKIILEKYNGQIPDSYEELIKLPGVGTKTANLVLSLAFNKDGLCVDTHVHRISNRWEVIDTNYPEESELELKKILPKKYWKDINRLLVLFGRSICSPNPKCNICYPKIKEICPYYKKLTYLKNILNSFKFKKINKKDIPNQKGTYILKLAINTPKNIKIGSLGNIPLKRGYYFYIGSAYGNSINLKTRISYHLKKDKKLKWHIDYLTKIANIREIYTSPYKIECEVAKEFLKKGFYYIPKFGCSDCKCKSHLFYLKF